MSLYLKIIMNTNKEQQNKMIKLFVSLNNIWCFSFNFSLPGPLIYIRKWRRLVFFLKINLQKESRNKKRLFW